MDFLIANVKGDWWMNNGRHNFNDPDSNTLFPPGVAVKATTTAWLESQEKHGVFGRVADPLAEAPGEGEKAPSAPATPPPKAPAAS